MFLLRRHGDWSFLKFYSSYIIITFEKKYGKRAFIKVSKTKKEFGCVWVDWKKGVVWYTQNILPNEPKGEDVEVGIWPLTW